MPRVGNQASADPSLVGVSDPEADMEVRRLIDEQRIQDATLHSRLHVREWSDSGQLGHGTRQNQVHMWPGSCIGTGTASPEPRHW